MKHETFSLLIWLNTAKTNKQGTAPIYGRITVNGQRAEVALGHRADPQKWNNVAGCVKGKNMQTDLINTEIEKFKMKVKRLYNECMEKGEYCSAAYLKHLITGKKVLNDTLLNFYDRHLNEVEKLIGIDYARATYVKFKTTGRYLKQFIQTDYNKKDVSLKELNYSFIKGFENYLKIHARNRQNSTSKHIQRLRKVIRIAVNNDQIAKDPFLNYTYSWEKTEREFLSQDELQRIEDKGFSVDRLNHIKNIFLFACYTGMAYIDISNLRASHISQGVDGELWIKGKRQKTDTTYMIPLLPQAEVILQRYADYPEAILKGKLLPVPSNQKVNAYLKEIADICGINKYLTFHMARHTFATTVTLTNGVPIESVSKMLGHTNIKTTQIYSRVVEEKISKDMSVLRSKFSIERKREAT